MTMPVYRAAMDEPPGMTDISFPLLMFGSWAIFFGLSRSDPPRWLRSILAITPVVISVLYLIRRFHLYMPSGIGFPAAFALTLCTCFFAADAARGGRKSQPPTSDGEPIT